MASNHWEQMEMETHLRQALGKGELVVYYQPQVSLDTGEIIGMEALVRWNHAEFGLISPAQFIPLAEETGLIIPIGEWCYVLSVRQTKDGNRQAFRRCVWPLIFRRASFGTKGLKKRLFRRSESVV